MIDADRLDGFGPDRLDAFVALVDAAGGPDPSKLAGPFRYRPATMPDVTLDPFSEDYVRQMTALYTEISGRPLDQGTGELLDFDMDRHVGGANPYAERNAGFIARHARTVLTVVMAANLPCAPRVLDLGCGWGLSTEMLAFTGAEVTAVDINPHFAELVRRRAARQSRALRVVCSNFDDLEVDGLHDLALFYECLHHAVRPWETIRRVSRFLKPDARIAIAGEPINEIWWPHWGLRLDPVSIYCIRK